MEWITLNNSSAQEEAATCGNHERAESGERDQQQRNSGKTRNKYPAQKDFTVHHAFTTGFPTLKTFPPFHHQQIAIKDADIPNPPIIVVNMIINYY